MNSFTMCIVVIRPFLRVVNDDDDDEGETATAAAVQFVSKSNPLLLLFDSFLRSAKRNYRGGRKSNSSVGIQWHADDNYARKFYAAVVDLVLNLDHFW